jgi:chemotaxis protein CheX
MPGISSEHVNPFLKATIETYRAMFGGIAATPSKPVPVKGSYDLAGVIGISGEVTGYVSMGYTLESALKSVSTMIGEELTELSPDVMDAVGEIANIVAGYAKKDLQARISISLPEVVQGGSLPGVGQPGFFTFVVPFNCELGGFDVIVTLKPST